MIENIKYMLSDNVQGRNLFGGDRCATYLKLIKFEEFIKYCKEL